MANPRELGIRVDGSGCTVGASMLSGFFFGIVFLTLLGVIACSRPARKLHQLARSRGSGCCWTEISASTSAAALELRFNFQNAANRVFLEAVGGVLSHA
jgi:hypothetical protein